MATQTLPPPDRLADAAPAAVALAADGMSTVAPPGDAIQPAATTQPSNAAYWLDADSPGLPITLDLRPLLGGKTLAEIDFNVLWAFIAANDWYAIEYNETGELVIMPPMLMPGGNTESRLIAFVTMWSLAYGGMTPSSATVFRIPGVGGRGPDASWVSPERLAGLDAEQYRTGQVCPDFAAEIRSASNTLAYLQRKMEQYIAAGVRLGWLIDPRNRRVTVYRPGREPEILDNPSVLNGEDVMPGFEFRVGELIFDAA